MSETEYESVAKLARREHQIAGLEQGAHLSLVDMSTDEMLLELLWTLRKATVELTKVMEGAKSNPMLSMMFKK